MARVRRRGMVETARLSLLYTYMEIDYPCRTPVEHPYLLRLRMQVTEPNIIIRSYRSYAFRSPKHDDYIR